MNDKVIEVLRRARDVELPTRGWYQGAMTGPDGEVCAKGALVKAFEALAVEMPVTKQHALHESLRHAERVMRDVVGGSVPIWNDEWCETVADVFDGFDLAIKRLEEQS